MINALHMVKAQNTRGPELHSQGYFTASIFNSKTSVIDRLL
jgi:hypothetical protein